MSENNQMMSLEGQLVGMPLAGPESFSQQQLNYLKRALGVDETVLWENASGFKYGDAAVQLSEAITNFSEVRLYLKRNTSSSFLSSITNFVLIFGVLDNSGVWPKTGTTTISISGTTMTYVANRIEGGSTNTLNHWSNVADEDTHIVKVVGIHRIAGGN